MMPRVRSVMFLSVLMVLTNAAVASAQKDVVTTITGENLVGEIKKVEKDVLTMSTAYSDSDFQIEWDKIVSIESGRQFLVETFDGRRLSGPLRVDATAKATIQVGDVSVALAELSAMVP